MEMDFIGKMNGLNFFQEFLYSAVMAFFLIVIYAKTKEMYELTGHRGIKYFRYAFLFLSLGYVSRLIMKILHFNFFGAKGMFHFFIIFISYFGFMALFYLGYSLWKRYDKAPLYFNILAIVASMLIFFYGTIQVMIMLQALLFLMITIGLINKSKNVWKLYGPVLLFWIIHLITLNPRYVMPIEIRAFFQILSIATILFVYYKVSKWA